MTMRKLFPVALALLLASCGSDCTYYFGPGPALCCADPLVGTYRQVAAPGPDGTASAWVGSCVPRGTAPASDRPGSRW